MKELSIEEKAKAYDKVREKIAVRFGTNAAEEIFSEFEESEDERIRKDCIKYLNWEYQHCLLDEDKMKIEKCIVWLEKQGRQETTDKIKPKFKVGDRIIFNGLVLLIKEVVQGYYRTISVNGIPHSYDWDIDNIARLWTAQDAKVMAGMKK